MRQSLDITSLGVERLRAAHSSYERLATVLLQYYQTEEALKLYSRALKSFQKIASEAPDDLECQALLASLHEKLAALWIVRHNFDQAHDAATAALAIRQENVDAAPNSGLYQIDLLFTCKMLSIIEEARDDYEGSIQWCKTANKDWEALNSDGKLDDQPKAIKLRADLQDRLARSELKLQTQEDLDGVLSEHPEMASDLLQAYAHLSAKRKNFDEAKNAIERLAALPDKQPIVLDFAAYSCGRITRIIATQLDDPEAGANLRKDYDYFADRCLELLDQAQSGGAYFSPESTVYLRYSDAYCELRETSRFQTILASVSSASPRHAELTSPTPSNPFLDMISGLEGLK